MQCENCGSTDVISSAEEGDTYFECKQCGQREKGEVTNNGI